MKMEYDIFWFISSLRFVCFVVKLKKINDCQIVDWDIIVLVV